MRLSTSRCRASSRVGTEALGAFAGGFTESAARGEPVATAGACWVAAGFETVDSGRVGATDFAESSGAVVAAVFTGVIVSGPLLPLTKNRMPAMTSAAVASPKITGVTPRFAGGAGGGPGVVAGTTFSVIG